MTTSEFSVETTWQADHRGPGKWILSHALRHKWFILLMLLGAAGNAWLASTQPLLTGRAFDAVIVIPADLKILGRVALFLGLIQMVRGLGMQMLRNISAETLGQRLERDIRDELYISLVGKSMAFHDSYPTGDLMARATNDVREINFMFNPGFNMVIGSANFILMPLFYILYSICCFFCGNRFSRVDFADGKGGGK